MAASYQDHAPAAMAPYKAQPLGYQQLTTAQLGTAQGLTRPGDNAVYALINVEGIAGTDTVRWRDDGTAPTTTVGMLMNATGDQRWPPFRYEGDLTAIQFIKAAGSPIVNVSYYR